jgi:DNA-binding transcriptional LysR family regulator
MSMTLEQLRIFVEAAHYNSFTLAADRLGLTQSAVSISIRKLEEGHNVKLFNRVGRRMVVTEAGQILLGEAERILKDVELTIKRMESYQDMGRRRAIVACSRNAYDHWMPGILARIGSKKELPDLDIVCGTAVDVAAWVMRGTADCGVSESAPGHQEFRYVGVFRDSLILCATRAWAERLRLMLPLCWNNLADCSPIIWEVGTETEVFIRDALERNGIDRRMIAHERLSLTSTAAVMSLVESGRYPALVTQSAARMLLASDELVKLGRMEIPIPYWLFAPRHREIEPLGALIAKAAAEMSNVSNTTTAPMTNGAANAGRLR